MRRRDNDAASRKKQVRKFDREKKNSKLKHLHAHSKGPAARVEKWSIEVVLRSAHRASSKATRLFRTKYSDKSNINQIERKVRDSRFNGLLHSSAMQVCCVFWIRQRE